MLHTHATRNLWLIHTNDTCHHNHHFLLNFQSNLLSTLFQQIPNDIRENLNHTFHLNFTAQQYHASGWHSNKPNIHYLKTKILIFVHTSHCPLPCPLILPSVAVRVLCPGSCSCSTQLCCVTLGSWELAAGRRASWPAASGPAAPDTWLALRRCLRCTHLRSGDTHHHHHWHPYKWHHHCPPVPFSLFFTVTFPQPHTL